MTRVVDGLVCFFAREQRAERTAEHDNIHLLGRPQWADVS
jgi:hypothetical protein